MDNILEIKNLSVHYGKYCAINNISLDIPKGKIIGLLGPNSSGKTTLIKAIMGLLNSYTGDIRIAGEKPGYEANKHISYMPDVRHIPKWFTPSQAIGLFADFYEDFDKEKAQEMLHSMGLPTDKKLSHLSRGTQDKIQLALVMSRNARIYILDEPLGAVDPASREFIINTILKNFPEDSSIFMSTHIIADVEPILDKALFLRRGQIVIHEDADTIREERNMSLDRLFKEVYRHVY